MTRSAITTGCVRVLVCVFLNRISFPSFFDSTHLFLTLTTTAKTSRRPEMSVFLAASLKSLNKQEYQQSASPRCLCERRHTGLFVLRPGRKLLFRDTVARSFFFFSPARASWRGRLERFHTLLCWSLQRSPCHRVCV